MKPNPLNLQVMLILSVAIPWPPHPSIFRPPCPHPKARLVRKLYDHKWLPILRRFKVDHVPLECPLHPQRDVFAPQNAARRQHRPRQWTCGLCGKSFYDEPHLDRHLENRHQTDINLDEDAVCLADFCDIMRCDVLLSTFRTTLTTSATTTTTDLDIWHHQYLTQGDISRQHMSSSVSNERRDLSTTIRRMNDDDDRCHPYVRPPVVTFDRNVTAGDDSIDSSECQRRRIELFRVSCQPETLQKLKTKCEILIRHCIYGLIVELSEQEFRDVEDELNRAICWYLTCDRYWEDAHSDEQKTFPWGLLGVIVMVLSLGICLCYYIVWVLFDTDSSSSTMTDRSTPTPIHHHQHRGGGAVPSLPPPPPPPPPPRQDFGDDYYLNPEQQKDGASGNDYIYVTYPPEIKRRLLDSCYNRTTHL